VTDNPKGTEVDSKRTERNQFAWLRSVEAKESCKNPDLVIVQRRMLR